MKGIRTTKTEDTLGKNSGDRGREGRDDRAGKGEEAKEDGEGGKEERKMEEGSRKSNMIRRRKEGRMGEKEE